MSKGIEDKVNSVVSDLESELGNTEADIERIQKELQQIDSGIEITIKTKYRVGQKLYVRYGNKYLPVEVATIIIFVQHEELDYRYSVYLDTPIADNSLIEGILEEDLYEEEYLNIEEILKGDVDGE